MPLSRAAARRKRRGASARCPTSRPSARPTDQEMARDPSVVVFGLDVDDPKAIQGTTRGLLEKYGPERVFGTPLSEDAMTGAAIGMALAGLRPIHVHIRMDFLMLAMNQLVNVAAKSRYMYGGQVARAAGRAGDDRQELGPGGAALAGAAQLLHARARASRWSPRPRPTTPRAASLAAVRDDDPVLFVEHRLLHFQKGPVPEEPYTVTPGQGARHRAGRGRHAGRHLVHAGRVPAGRGATSKTSASRPR